MKCLKNLVIISFTDVSKDPRVNRQIRFLEDSFNITAIGGGEYESDNVKVESCLQKPFSMKEKIVGGITLLSANYEKFYWSQQHIIKCAQILKIQKADYIIANDIESLPVAIKYSNGAKVMLDAHEYSPRQFEDRLKWKVFMQGYMNYLCREYIGKAHVMTTVCEGIANEYKRNFNVEPIIITNSPDFEELCPSEIGNKIRIVHHGVAIKSRHIENMIRMMDYLDDRFELNLILVPNQKNYFLELKKMASTKKNINFLEPVPMRQISKFINQFDIGLFLLEPVNFNYKNALPNKFFEYVQGRLAIAIGPSPEMKRLLERDKLGVVSEDFTPKSLATVINSLTKDEIAIFKKNSNKNAYSLSAENNKQLLRSLLNVGDTNA